MPSRWSGMMIVLALALMLVACARETAPQRPVREQPPAGGTGSAMVAAPGIYETDEGAQAIGTLRYVELEGGFWVVTDDTATGGGGTVAVLVGAEDLGVDLNALSGRYVAANGTRLEGASIRMAGPEIQVTAISEVGPDVIVEPGGDATK